MRTDTAEKVLEKLATSDKVSLIPPLQFMTVDNFGLFVDLSKVHGQLFDPTVLEITRGERALEGRPFGRVKLKNGTGRTYSDPELMEPYLRAWKIAKGDHDLSEALKEQRRKDEAALMIRHPGWLPATQEAAEVRGEQLMRTDTAEKVLEKLATSDKVSLIVERQPDGKMRVTSGSWDGEKVFLRDQVLEGRCVEGRLHIARKPRQYDEWDRYIPPYDPTALAMSSSMTDVAEARHAEFQNDLAMSEARHARKRRHARAVLAPVYGRFSEGFESADLVAAKSLLERSRSGHVQRRIFITGPIRLSWSSATRRTVKYMTDLQFQA